MHDRASRSAKSSAPRGPAGLKARWLAWRNRVLADPGFQAWASRFPLTRPMARRSARRLFDTIAGFTYSQTIVALVQAGLIDRLAEGASDEASLALASDLPLPALQRLLRAGQALGLVEPLGDHWALGQLGAALAGNPGAQAMIRHHHLLYADLADPLGLLRGERRGAGALAGYWPYALGDGSEGRDPSAVADYSALMAASQPMVAQQAIGAYDFRRHRAMLDVGGGAGAFVRAVAAAAPELELALFDLPAVAGIARDALAEAGVAAIAHAGDFRTDPIPKGHDLITLVRILHDHDDALAQRLLDKIHSALPSGGTLLIIEPMAGTPGAEAMADAYFGFYLLAMGSGRARTADEIGAMLERAGFDSWQEVSTALPMVARIIRASRRG